MRVKSMDERKRLIEGITGGSFDGKDLRVMNVSLTNASSSSQISSINQME